MPDRFNMQIPPFCELSPSQQQHLRGELDIAYFRQQQAILRTGQASNCLFILIKGGVEERSAEKGEVYAHYTTEDMFDVRALFEEKARHDYIALEDTLCYLLPKSSFLDLYQQNQAFAQYFDPNLKQRQAKSEQSNQTLAEFMLCKVDESHYHRPLIVDATSTIEHSTHAMLDARVDSAVVRLEPEKYGIITRTDLLHGLILSQNTSQDSVGELASYPAHSINKGEFLFDALLKMTKHRVKRLVVMEDQHPVGIVDLTQILSVFSTHSHVIGLQIARANSLEELMLASDKQHHFVDNLVTNGIRTRFVMQLIAAINQQIMEKAFELIVPKAYQSQCCLVVMGSEGRQEQILKTDQDNALIIKDNLEWTSLPQVMQKLTNALEQLGYPLCDGNIMVSNPEWVKSEAHWEQALEHWSQSPTPQTMMKLAIMSDAHAVAGDATLLEDLKKNLIHQLTNKMSALSQFVRPALAFSTPLTLFGNVKTKQHTVDIKQGGLFTIIHGIRTLSLEHRIEETNTFDRIERLAEKHVLATETADNLHEAFKLFSKLRLQQQLKFCHSQNTIEVDSLDRMERDLLRHSLHVVKKFKQWLGYHYQIRD